MKALEHSLMARRLMTVAIGGIIFTAFVLAGMLVWAMVFFRGILYSCTCRQLPTFCSAGSIRHPRSARS
jgi:hypothetical protein